MKTSKYMALMLVAGLAISTAALAGKTAEEKAAKADARALKKVTKKISRDVHKDGGQSDHKTYNPDTKKVDDTEKPTEPGPNHP